MTADFGYGHITAAKSIEEGIHDLYPDTYNVEVIDYVALANSFISRATKKVYDSTIRYIPKSWELIFENSDRRETVKLVNFLSHPFMVRNLDRLLREKNPDLIISTYALWDSLVRKRWGKFHPHAPFISVVTDSIHIHAMWAAANADFYMVANRDTKASLQKLDVASSKIKVYGFPLSRAFRALPKTVEAKKVLGLNPKVFTILLIANTGIVGKDPLRLLRMIDRMKLKKTMILVITGKNKKLRTTLDEFAKKAATEIKTYGWVSNMPDFLAASGLVLTKAGGATVMECIAAAKPLIITKVVPGQEEGNAKLVMKYNLGQVLDHGIKELPGKIRWVIKHYNVIEKNLRRLRIPDASLRIARFVRRILRESE